jgi:phosphatidylinositol-3-phosphatase
MPGGGTPAAPPSALDEETHNQVSSKPVLTNPTLGLVVRWPTVHLGCVMLERLGVPVVPSPKETPMTRRRVALPGRSRRPSWMARHRVAGPVLVLAAISTLAAAGVGAAAQASSHSTRTRAAAVAHVTASKHTVTHTAVTHTAVTHTAVTHTAGTQAAANQICGTRVAGSVRVTHVIWIVMENRSYNQVMPAPYISSLASHCGVATNYHNISHPSLPNYIAMTSGRSVNQLPATDCPNFCSVSGPSIFSQTSSWGVYAESMPGNCVRHDVRPYVAHHTAAPYYSALTSCASRDVPLTSLNLSRLPAFALIVPNISHDMHENSSSVAAGDSWLRTHLGAILSSPVYRSGSTVVFVTWDEGGTPRSTNNCATNTTDPGCHVALLVMSPFTQPGMRWSALANHYSLLKVTQHLLGLAYLGQSAAAPSLNAAFRL